MAKFYDVVVKWKSGKQSTGRGIGNNAAWNCQCGSVLLGPYADLYSIPPCPSCGRCFVVERGEPPQFVSAVREK